jgi:hypothetical protein
MWLKIPSLRKMLHISGFESVAKKIHLAKFPRKMGVFAANAEKLSGWHRRC